MKVVDITDKLNFDESPALRIKGRTLRVNADAPTMLKIMNKVSDLDKSNPKQVMEMYELLFPRKTREELDKMKLSFADLLVVIQEGISLITDTGTPMGEAEAPATTS